MATESGPGRVAITPLKNPPSLEETPMRLSASTPLALAAGLATLALAGPAVAAPATVQVGKGGDKFVADNVTVNTGEAVTWHWVSGTHNVHFTGTAPTGGDIDFQSSSGGDKSRTFSKAGTYSYLCEAHDGMTGTVTVVDAPAGTPPAAGGSTGSTGTATAPTTTGSSAQPVTGSTGSAAGADAAPPTVRGLAFRANALRLQLSEASKLELRYVRSGTKGHVVTKRVISGKAGANAISVRRWMRPGRYRVSIIAIDAAGNASRPARLQLTVRR
jgi:plastocyanin